MTTGTGRRDGREAWPGAAGHGATSVSEVAANTATFGLMSRLCVGQFGGSSEVEAGGFSEIGKAKGCAPKIERSGEHRGIGGRLHPRNRHSRPLAFGPVSLSNATISKPRDPTSTDRAIRTVTTTGPGRLGASVASRTQFRAAGWGLFWSGLLA